MISTYDFFMMSWNDGVPNTDIEAYATTPAAVAKIYQGVSKINNSSVHKNIAGLAHVIQKAFGTRLDFKSRYAAQKSPTSRVKTREVEM